MKAVITTINQPTKAVKKLCKLFPGLIVIGDVKTPKDWKHKDASYYSIKSQRELYELAKHLPCHHYSRKNIGYLIAIREGASCIYDTDDDNIPNARFRMRSLCTQASAVMGKGWYNVYKAFAEEEIWPRGFSLKHLYGPQPKIRSSEFSESPVQQGMADGDPDVDAIWRLTMAAPVYFTKELSVKLSSGTWCPFNSQSTWWFPQAYPLLYLPVNVSFRMTDIWRSFIAQRCLWEIKQGVTFHSPAEVFQDRNEHDLIKDFEQEIPGYLNNHKIAELLINLPLDNKPELISANMFKCYQVLTEAHIIPKEELPLVESWINSIT